MSSLMHAPRSGSPVARLFALIVVVLFLATGAVMAANAPAHADDGEGAFDGGVNTLVDGADAPTFSAGYSVVIDGDIDGDVYAAGQTVTVNGTVDGDVLAAGQTVLINGTVNGSVRATGQTVIIGGEVENSVSVAAQTLTIGSGAEVGRDVAYTAQNVAIAGSVGRDVNGMSDSLSLTGSIGRDLTYSAVQPIDDASATAVDGTVERFDASSESDDEAASDHVTQSIGGMFVGWLLGLIYSMIALVVLAIVVTAIFPGWVHRSRERTYPQPWMALLVGAVVLLAAPVAFVLALVTVIGIPLAILLLLALLTLSMLGHVCFAALLGRWILRRSPSLLLQTLVGAVVLSLAVSVPSVGWLASLFATFVGVGSLLIPLWSVGRTPRVTETAPAADSPVSTPVHP